MRKIAAEKNYKLLKEAAIYALGDLEARLRKVEPRLGKVETRLTEVEINGGKQTKINSKAIVKIVSAFHQLVARVVFLSDKKKSGQ